MEYNLRYRVDFSDEDYEAVQAVGPKNLVVLLLDCLTLDIAVEGKWSQLGKAVLAQYGAETPGNLSTCGKAKFLSLKQHWFAVIKSGLPPHRKAALDYTDKECKVDEIKKKARRTAKQYCENTFRRVTNYAYPPKEVALPSELARKKRKLEEKKGVYPASKNGWDANCCFSLDSHPFSFLLLPFCSRERRLRGEARGRGGRRGALLPQRIS